MARRFAQFHVNRWTDPVYTALPPELQHMHMVLASQPRTNLCGVLDFIPTRLALCCDQWTVDDVERLVKDLETTGLVVVDYDSREILVRSMMRDDGILKVPNVAKGAAADFGEVMSRRLSEAIEQELKQLFTDDPTMAGWKGLKDVNPVLFERVTGGPK